MRKRDNGTSSTAEGRHDGPAPEFSTDAARAVLFLQLIECGLPEWATANREHLALARLCGWTDERAASALCAALIYDGPPQGDEKTGPTDVDRAGIFVELLGFGHEIAVERGLALMCGWSPHRVARALDAAQRAGLIARGF